MFLFYMFCFWYCAILGLFIGDWVASGSMIFDLTKKTDQGSPISAPIYTQTVVSAAFPATTVCDLQL